MSLIDLLKNPIYALVAVGGVAAAAGGGYYYLTPVQQAHVQQSPESTSPSATSPGVNQSPAQATAAIPLSPFPMKLKFELDGAAIVEGEQCDMARTPQMICQVQFRRPGSSVNQRLYIQRYPHDITRAMVYFEYGGSQDKPNAGDLTAAILGKGTPLSRSDGTFSGLRLTIRQVG